MLILALVLSFMQVTLPRRYAWLPLCIACCYTTTAWTISIGPVDMFLTRILVLIGLVRVAFRKELTGVRLLGADRILAAWLVVVTFLYILFDGTNVTLIGRLGYASDAAGAYVLVRAFVRSVDDVALVVRSLAIIIVPLACLLLMERSTGHNIFSALGGVAEFSEVRNGRVRAQGSFPHPILTGTFGATLLPLFVGLWIRERKSRWIALTGGVAAFAMVYAATSSGALSALAVGIMGLLCWPVRAHMRLIRWAFAMAILAAAVVMKAPVWFLISKVSGLTGGGSGWYRSELIDAAMRHLGEWWLIGTGQTRSWMPTGIPADSTSADIVNEFLAQGVRGGLLAMTLYIWLIVKCFATVGTAVRNERDHGFPDRFFAWTLGCGLLGHTASFFSVSYFGQMISFWMLYIGLIVALHGMAPSQVPKMRAKRGLAFSPRGLVPKTGSSKSVPSR